MNRVILIWVVELRHGPNMDDTNSKFDVDLSSNNGGNRSDEWSRGGSKRPKEEFHLELWFQCLVNMWIIEWWSLVYIYSTICGISLKSHYPTKQSFAISFFFSVGRSFSMNEKRSSHWEWKVSIIRFNSSYSNWYSIKITAKSIDIFSINHEKMIFINSNLHTCWFIICIRKGTVTNIIHIKN